MNLYFTHPTENPVYPKEIMDNRDKVLFYPEEGMSTLQQLQTARPADYHIVTNCPFFIGQYQQEEVFVWHKERKRWENPDFNTYGTSHNKLIVMIVGYRHTIPQAVIDGKVTNCMGQTLKYRD